MRTRGVMIIGIFLIVMGVIALASNLTGINFSNACLPTVLILMGLLVLLRPRTVKEGVDVDFILLGDYKRSGVWKAAPLELWSGLGDVKLDFSQADVPEGETPIHIYHLIGDVVLRPGDVAGLSLTANNLLGTVKWMGAKQDNFLNSLQFSTANYSQAERKLLVEVTNLIGDVKVQASTPSD